jgi:hypothetical protein
VYRASIQKNAGNDLPVRNQLSHDTENLAKTASPCTGPIRLIDSATGNDDPRPQANRLLLESADVSSILHAVPMNAFDGAVATAKCFVKPEAGGRDSKHSPSRSYPISAY